MPTIEQIRAARALLDWSQKDLADHAGLSQTGIARIEKATHKPTTTTLGKIEKAFDRAGINFIADRGIEKRTLDIQTFSGADEYMRFFDDVYETIKATGGDIAISGVDETRFNTFFKDGGDYHRNRMAELDNYHMRCLICEGDQNFASNEYCEYRWTPKKLFEAVPFYVYGDKLALMNFEPDDVNIYVVHFAKIAKSFRKQFDIQWANAIFPEPHSDKKL